MDNIVRDIGALNTADRQALEHLLGQPLHENQQVVIQVVTAQPHPPARSQAGNGAAGGSPLPEWCHVYAGLSDEEIADLEKVVLTRADLTRSVE